MQIKARPPGPGAAGARPAGGPAPRPRPRLSAVGGRGRGLRAIFSAIWLVKSLTLRVYLRVK